MERKAITEEMHLEKEWFEQSKKIQTLDELTQFIKKVLTSYSHDYGTACHAIAACAVACAWYGSYIECITGFQASFVMWDFIRNWTKGHNKCGLRLVDYDDFLFPQYAYKYDKVLSADTWEAIQKEATRCLDEDSDGASSNVINHWKNISEGVVPFGYRVEEENKK